MHTTSLAHPEMLIATTIFALVTSIIAVTNPQADSVIFGVASKGQNATKFKVLDVGVYQILRAEIDQTTVNISSNVSVLTTREDFAVVVQGTENGALPVRCNASWLSFLATYPAEVSFSCTDPAVNLTLLQGEVWPEYGGFFLFVELK